MKRIAFFTLLVVFARTFSFAQNPQRVFPVLQQTGLYFSSDRVTVEGVGVGAGAIYLWKEHLVAQGDVNLLWGDGNAISTRIAAGYRRAGTWSPTVLGTCALLWGQRVEMLSPTGERPPTPVWVLGIRVAPLRFETAAGVVSALELGYGIGPAKGMALDLTILSLGAAW